MKKMYIGFCLDDTDGVFDRSEVIVSENIDEIPDLCGVYELTKEGLEIYEEWCEDVSVGYDLCYGRMQGLANEIGGTQRDIWNYLISNESLTKVI